MNLINTKLKYKIKLSPKEAQKILFWNYHANEFLMHFSRINDIDIDLVTGNNVALMRT